MNDLENPEEEILTAKDHAQLDKEERQIKLAAEIERLKEANVELDTQV